MKGFLLTVAVFVWLSTASHGQTLEPKLYASGTDTAFCFNRHQIKEIAKLITKGYFSDQTVDKQKQIISSLQTKLLAKDLIIRNQYEQIQIHQADLAGKDTLISLSTVQIRLQKDQLDAKEQTIITQKTMQRRLVKGGLILTLVSFVVGLVL